MDRASGVSTQAVREQLESAICLLAFVTKRLLDDEAREALENVEGPNDPVAFSSADDDNDDVESLGGDDTRLNDNGGIDESLDEAESLLETETQDQEYRAELHSKLLDRLAETAARFKSRPGCGGVDSKHVCSTMMVIQNDESKVDIICSKNGGLNDEDLIFLRDWESCMQVIARKGRQSSGTLIAPRLVTYVVGSASENDHDAMHDMVFRHQRPRIKGYLRWLRHAFEQRGLSSSSKSNLSGRLEDLLATQKVARSLTWIDDNGFTYTIDINQPSTQTHAQPSEPISIHMSAPENATDIFTVIESIHKLGEAGILEETRDDILKSLMKNIFELWKGIRTRSAIKAYLDRQFAGEPKRKKEAENALIFLAKVYYSVRIFIRGAELSPIFQSVKSRGFHYEHPKTKSAPMTRAYHPLQAYDLLKEKRAKDFFHAELQTLYYYDNILSPTDQAHTHPYIGCSKLNCALCYLFLCSHGRFSSRGTHGSILHRWDIPGSTSANTNYDRLGRFLATLKYILQSLLEKPCPVSSRELRAQSSKALSSAQSLLEKETMAMERSPRDIPNLMMGGFVMGDRYLITKILSEPGKAYVVGGGNGRHKSRVSTMTVGEAEILEANYTRSKFGFEPLGEVMSAPTSNHGQSKCRRCERASGYRCSRCRVIYCSKTCQRKDWSKHVFVCCVKNHPNDADHLKFIVRWWLHTQTLVDKEGYSQLMSHIYADNHFCRTFGFNQCLTHKDISNLMCIYNAFRRNFQSAFIQSLIDSQKLGQLLEKWILWRSSREDCDCIPWFMRRRSEGYEIPNREAPYTYELVAMKIVQDVFKLGDAELTPLTDAEKQVFGLYIILFRDFNNIPTPLSVEWVRFGICFCSNTRQKEALSTAYIRLSKSGATLAEITHAWKEQSLIELLKRQGVDVSDIEDKGINLHGPPIVDLAIYRLVTEVTHALSGFYCQYFRASCNLHSKHEHILHKQSEGDYGFTGTSAWERWQLLNFYRRVFSLPGFSPREMQNARRDPDPLALEQYLDSLVPGFRLAICDIRLADGTFPRLGDRVSFPNGLPDCNCFMHPICLPGWFRGSGMHDA